MTKTVQKHIKSPNYNDLIERGCLIIEISDKSKSSPSLIPGAIVANSKEVKRKIDQFSQSSRPILLTSKKPNSLSAIQKKMESKKIECYIGGTPQSCYQHLIQHQYILI